MFAIHAQSSPTLWQSGTSSESLQWLAATDFSEQAQAKLGFWQGLSAEIVATNGVVVAGDFAGQLEAYGAVSGDVLWRHNTTQLYTTVNGREAKGGSLTPMDHCLLMIYYGSSRGWWCVHDRVSSTRVADPAGNNN